jgi:hypothetical protein
MFWLRLSGADQRTTQKAWGTSDRTRVASECGMLYRFVTWAARIVFLVPGSLWELDEKPETKLSKEYQHCLSIGLLSVRLTLRNLVMRSCLDEYHAHHARTGCYCDQ